LPPGVVCLVAAGVKNNIALATTTHGWAHVRETWRVEGCARSCARMAGIVKTRYSKAIEAPHRTVAVRRIVRLDLFTRSGVPRPGESGLRRSPPHILDTLRRTLVKSVSGALKAGDRNRVRLARTNIQRCSILAGHVGVNNVELPVETLVDRGRRHRAAAKWPDAEKAQDHQGAPGGGLTA